MAQGKRFLLGALLFLLVVSTSAVIHNWVEDYRLQSQIKKLTPQLHGQATAAPGQTPEAEDAAKEPPEPVMLERFHALYAQNPDIAGWIQIDGTGIDYPVMRSREDPEFYLRHDFEGRKNKNGLPFLDESCQPDDSDILLIHGHNMKSGLMFSDLVRYKEERFYRAHPLIRFDTLYEEGEYEIIAVILAQALYEGDSGFRYYDFNQITSENAFAEYMKNIQALALYKTDATASFGDRLIVLSTCEYSRENGRIAVIARKN